jgi:hypothetical protein
MDLCHNIYGVVRNIEYILQHVLHTTTYFNGSHTTITQTNIRSKVQHSVNMSHPSSGSKNKPSEKLPWKHLCLPPAFTSVSCLSFSSTVKWRRHVSQKRRNVLHSVISRKIEVFMTTAVRTSNPTIEKNATIILFYLLLKNFNVFWLTSANYFDMYNLF